MERRNHFQYTDLVATLINQYYEQHMDELAYNVVINGTRLKCGIISYYDGQWEWETPYSDDMNSLVGFNKERLSGMLVLMGRIEKSYE